MIVEKIAFIILTWNSASYLKNCLNSVLALPFLAKEIIIIDNGSKDHTVNILEDYKQKYPDHFKIFYLAENVGTTKARNIGLKNVNKGMEWICILDSDTIVNTKAIESMIEALQEDKDLWLVCPRMFSENKEEQRSCKKFPSFKIKFLKALPWKYFQHKGEQAESYHFFPGSNLDDGEDDALIPPLAKDKAVYEVNYGISACWLFPKTILDSIGFLDESYFYAPEDVDYCVMIHKAGGKVGFVSHASIYHITQRLSKKRLWSRHNYLHLKGLIYYNFKHGKWFRNRKDKG